MTSTISEEWRDIPGVAGYQVSDLGRVRSVDRYVECEPNSSGVQRAAYKRRIPGRILAASVRDEHGHLSVYFGKEIGTRCVHVFVAAAFIGPRPPGYDVAHKNTISGDNRATNLSYKTRADNNRDLNMNGRRRCDFGRRQA